MSSSEFCARHGEVDPNDEIAVYLRARTDKEIRHVYVIGTPDVVKIGISWEPRERLRTLQVGSPIKLQLLWYSELVHGAGRIETAAHAKFASFHSHGEWFIAKAPDVIEFIKSEISKRQVIGESA